MLKDLGVAIDILREIEDYLAVDIRAYDELVEAHRKLLDDLIKLVEGNLDRYDLEDGIHTILKEFEL